MIQGLRGPLEPLANILDVKPVFFPRDHMHVQASLTHLTTRYIAPVLGTSIAFCTPSSQTQWEKLVGARGLWGPVCLQMGLRHRLIYSLQGWQPEQVSWDKTTDFTFKLSYEFSERMKEMTIMGRTLNLHFRIMDSSSTCHLLLIFFCPGPPPIPSCSGIQFNLSRHHLLNWKCNNKTFCKQLCSC